MKVTIKLETFLEILYFLNDWLRLMGFGSEYSRLSRLVWSLAREGAFRGISEKNFPHLRNVIQNFQRMEKTENGYK